MGTRGTQADTDIRTNAELALEAAKGNAEAFEALYSRLGESAWRVAHIITRDADAATAAVAEGFTRTLQELPHGVLADPTLLRSTLLAATRTAAIAAARWRQREGRQPAPTSPMPAAMGSLPERWRSVLWLTEVESVAPKDAAIIMGVTIGGVAEMAARARTNLRDRFAAARSDETVPAACRPTVDRLAGYVGGRLDAQAVAAVDEHVEACSDCRERLRELDDLGRPMAAMAAAVPAGVGAAVLAQWQLASSAMSAAATTLGSASSLANAVSALQKPLSLLAGGALIVGLVAVAPQLSERPDRPVVGTAVGDDSRAAGSMPSSSGEAAIRLASTELPVDSRPRSAPSIAAQPTAPTPLRSSPLPPASSGLPPVQSDTADQSLPQSSTAPPASPAPPTDATQGGDEPSDDGSPGQVAVGVAVKATALEAGVAVGDQCLGGYVDDTETGGCEPPEPEATTAGVTVVTGGTSPIGGADETLGV